MSKHIVKDQLLDLEVNHHVSVELALQQPPQRLQIRDVVADLRVAACGSSAASRRRPEQQPRGVQRPVGPRLEGAVIDHYRDRCGGPAAGGKRENRIGRSFTVLK